MRNRWQYTLATAVLVAGCATTPGSSVTVSDAEVLQTLKTSFHERGIAKLDRLDQSELQKECSLYATRPMPKEIRDRLSHDALVSVKFPADGKYLGNWKEGEKIAQSGRGLQFNDTEKTVAGGNCYACHQLTKAEIAYGNIGPSLYNYGKLRGSNEATWKYTWVRIWNAHAYAPCNNMPRFGAAGILTETQLKNVMALLLDPDSPVNQ